LEYTIGELAKLAGVSTRTLRYYDEIGLLKPAHISPAGYRYYGPAEVDRLQQILFYREFAVDLERIKQIVTSPAFDRAKALREHLHRLLAERARLDALIANVEKTIEALEGERTMTDREKFEGFKKALVEQNEKRYGREARERFGEESVDAANARLLKMTEEEHKQASALAAEIEATLKEAMKTGDPGGELAQKAADLHRQWLTIFWGQYSKEAHSGLAELYVDDPRFTAYYDREQPGTARFLRDAIRIYTGSERRG